MSTESTGRAGLAESSDIASKRQGGIEEISFDYDHGSGFSDCEAVKAAWDSQDGLKIRPRNRSFEEMQQSCQLIDFQFLTSSVPVIFRIRHSA